MYPLCDESVAFMTTKCPVKVYWLPNPFYQYHVSMEKEGKQEYFVATQVHINRCWTWTEASDICKFYKGSLPVLRSTDEVRAFIGYLRRLAVEAPAELIYIGLHSQVGIRTLLFVFDNTASKIVTLFGQGILFI